VFHDVTEQRRAEEALRASEARKDAILQSALDAIITIDSESRIVDFNPAAERIFGRSRDATLGLSLDQLMPASSRDHHHRGIVGYLETGDGPSLRQQFQTSALRADGTAFPAELAIVPIPGSQPALFTAFIRDITERQQAEQELRAAAERFRFTAESMPVKIFTATADGAVDYLNQQWMQFTGLGFEELHSRAALTVVHPEDLDETVKRWEHAVRTGKYFEIEHRFRDRHGAYFWHLSRAHAMHDSANRVVIWIGSSTNIDSQKRAEERLEQTVEQRTAALRETNEQLESFVYTIAHDLRAPLRAVAGYSQLLSQDHSAALDASAQYLLKRIQVSAEFMDRLILDLIAFGRTSRAQMELTSVDANRAWSIALAQHAGEARERRAKIETVGPLPHVRAHEATLGQVLANLLSNALKFIPAGEQPLVRFRAEDRGKTARLWVEDNGIGIPPEHQERIFRVFERLNGSHYNGTGIGLSIVRKGVERMGGTVGVESSPGGGSRFWIEMPKE
jgi:PAS domain S-box-containing protein